MNFRHASLEDLPFIVEVYNSTIPGRMVTADTSPVTVTDKLDWFRKHNSNKRPLWIVSDDSGDVGWLSFQDFYGRPAYDGTAEISLYLSDQARGKGYGKIILKHAIDEAASYNIHTLLGFIFAHNIPSITLFKLFGFEEWGHLENVAIIDNKKISLKIFGKKIHNY